MFPSSSASSSPSSSSSAINAEEGGSLPLQQQQRQAPNGSENSENRGSITPVVAAASAIVESLLKKYAADRAPLSVVVINMSALALDALEAPAAAAASSRPPPVQGEKKEGDGGPSIERFVCAGCRTLAAGPPAHVAIWAHNPGSPVQRFCAACCRFPSSFSSSS